MATNTAISLSAATTAPSLVSTSAGSTTSVSTAPVQQPRADQDIKAKNIARLSQFDNALKIMNCFNAGERGNYNLVALDGTKAKNAQGQELPSVSLKSKAVVAKALEQLAPIAKAFEQGTRNLSSLEDEKQPAEEEKEQAQPQARAARLPVQQKVIAQAGRCARLRNCLPSCKSVGKFLGHFVPSKKVAIGAIVTIGAGALANWFTGGKVVALARIAKDAVVGYFVAQPVPVDESSFGVKTLIAAGATALAVIVGSAVVFSRLKQAERREAGIQVKDLLYPLRQKQEDEKKLADSSLHDRPNEDQVAASFNAVVDQNNSAAI